MSRCLVSAHETHGPAPVGRNSRQCMPVRSVPVHSPLLHDWHRPDCAGGAQCQTPTLAHPRDSAGCDPPPLPACWRRRPTLVSAEQKALIVRSLPREGEVTVNGLALHKLAAVRQVLRAAERDAMYEIKVIDVPQAFIGLHARAVSLSRKQR